tara:strand:+ start:5493 stop:7052 length:1560 start_codon:yes stop_codon:yes gene_type:complete
MTQHTQHTDKSMLILDFGSQYTQLIARRIREMDVFCEIHSYTSKRDILEAGNWCGIILSGGPSTVLDEASPRAPDWVFSSNLPVLGICYGMQTMAIQLGGEIESSAIREFGYAELCLTQNHKFLEAIYDRKSPSGENLLDVWMSHGDHVTCLPDGFVSLAKTRDLPIAAMAHASKPWYGFQFHPEVTHTHQGVRILKAFVDDVCHADMTWTTEHILEELVDDIQQRVGSDHVMLALSGGVDSSVVAGLLHRAIGQNMHAVFVDTGLLRLGEAEEVEALFADEQGMNFTCIHAEERFLNALVGVDCPEEKRKIIGRTFIEVFEEEAKRLPEVKWLAQGTIYPDVIESAGIKSHHNVGGLPDALPFKLLEPIRALFKDEVRTLGVALGLPEERLHRHPFPGPGLGVRILGEIKPGYADILRQADAIFIAALREAELYHKVSQAFAVFLPVKSVGVMGDGRRYDPVICLRAVETQDFMTAHWAHLPWDFLGEVSNRIINEVAGISRVTYDISGKPPATIEWE